MHAFSHRLFGLHRYDRSLTCVHLLQAAHTGGCFGLAWDRGGKRLASAGADKSVKVWDSAGNHLMTLHVRPAPVSVCGSFTPSL